MRVIFIRRGQFSTYNVLVERCQLLMDVDVRWDRRMGDDRRSGENAIEAERRRRSRRQPADPDVDLRGYVVVELPDMRPL